MSKKFQPLDYSRGWDDYWRDHPQGYSPQEQMVNWSGQLNAMIDFFNEYFDVDLAEHTTDVMEGWYFDGRLDEIINEALFNSKADASETTTGLYNVKTKYNAPTDGTSAVFAFQTACDDIKAAGGGVLYVPTGTYYFDDVVLLPDNIIIECSGEVVFKSKVQLYGSQTIFKNDDPINGNKNIAIKNAVFDGDALGFTAHAVNDGIETTMLQFENVEHLYLLNCEVKNFKSDWNNLVDAHLYYAFHILECQHVKLENIYQHHCMPEGVAIIKSHKVKVINFTSDNNLNNQKIWTPLHVRTDRLASESTDIEIVNANIDGSTGSLMNVNGENILISGGSFVNAGRGIIDLGTEGMSEGEHSKNVKIIGATLKHAVGAVTGAQKTAIGFVGQSLFVENCFIENVEIGVSARDSKDIHINNVTIKDLVIARTDGGVLANGLFLRNVDGSHINNIVINNSESYGVRIETCNNVYITGGEVKQCTTRPIRLTGNTNLNIQNFVVDNSEVVDYSRSLIADTTPFSDGVNINNVFLTGTTGSDALSLEGTLNYSVLNVKGDNTTFFTGTSGSVVISSANNRNFRTPLQFGSSYLWVDSQGGVRVKTDSYPTSDNDGVLVGEPQP